MKGKQRTDYSKKFNGDQDNVSVEIEQDHISENEEELVSEPKVVMGRAKLEKETDKLNVRSGPGSEYDPVKEITVNDEFMIVDDSNPDWFKIVFSFGVEGFVMKQYVDIL